MNNDFQLRGDALCSATYDDAKRLSDEYEAYSFERFQDVGYSWAPTREMLLRHMLEQIDTRSSFRRSIRNLTYAVCCEAGAIVALLVRILLL